MAKRKDMKNLVDRNGHYHFRGYVPKDLIAVGYSGERVQSLNTSDYALAVERRDKQRVRHKQWIAEKRAQRDGRYLILDDLSDDQILGLARDAYRILFPSIEEHRVAQASRTATERGAAIKAEQIVLESLEIGAIEGSEPFGAFEYYTDKVLRNRMIRIQSWHAYSRLVLRVGDALIQIKREQIAAMQGKPGTEVNPLFVDIASGGLIASTNAPDGRPNARGNGNLSIQVQVKKYLEYISTRQQLKNINSSTAALEIFTKLIGRQREVNTLTREDFESFKSVILRLPPNAKKKYPNTPILKIAEIRKESDGHLKPESINGYLSRIIAFRNWLVETEVVVTIPELRKYKVPDPVNIKTKRDIFGNDHLRQLVESEQFRKYAKQDSVVFWAFAIGFYQGIRQGEIAGLLHSDYVVLNGIPCLRLHPDIAFKQGKKAGKPKTITREVPIHRVLIELGFATLFIPSNGGTHIFPEIVKALAKNPDRQRGDVISRKSSRLLKSLGFSESDYNIVFHSTRHTFEDACKRCRLVDGADNIFGGWTGDSTKDIHYGSGRFEPWMKAEIDKITYGDFDRQLIILKRELTCPLSEGQSV